MQATLKIQTTLSLALPDGDTGQYPRALVYDPSGSLDATVDLAHVANGMYQGNWTSSVEGSHVAVFIVYSDSGHTTENTSYPRTQEIVDVTVEYEQATVWVTYPTFGGDDANTGTARKPVATIAQAVTVAAANNLRDIRIRGDWFYEALSGPITGFTIASTDSTDVFFIDLNNQGVNAVTFEGVVLRGSVLTPFYVYAARDCLLFGPMANLGYDFQNCQFWAHPGDKFAIQSNVLVTMKDCSGNTTEGETIAAGTFPPPVFDLASTPLPTTLNMNGWSGSVVFDGMDDAASIINVECLAGKVEILSTCTAGTIRIRGDADVVNNSGSGCTVVDLSNPTLSRIGNAWSKDNVVWEDQVYDHTYQGRKFMTAADGWAYDSKANADTHDKSTGLLYTVHLSATYTDDECTNMTVTRDP